MRQKSRLGEERRKERQRVAQVWHKQAARPPRDGTNRLSSLPTEIKLPCFQPILHEQEGRKKERCGNGRVNFPAAGRGVKTGPSCLLLGVRHFVGDPPPPLRPENRIWMVSGRLLAHFSSLIYLRKGEGREEAVIAFYAADEQPTCSRVGRGRKGTVGKTTFFSTSTLTTLRPLFLFFCPFFRVVGIFPLSFNFFVRVVFFAVQENYLLAQTRREASLQHAILVRSAGDAVSQTFSTVHFAKCVGPLLPVMPF